MLESEPINAIIPSLLWERLKEPLLVMVPVEDPKAGFWSLSMSVNTTMVPALIMFLPVFQVMEPSLPAKELGDPIPVVSSSVK